MGGGGLRDNRVNMEIELSGVSGGRDAAILEGTFCGAGAVGCRWWGGVGQ